ncbi:MAG: DAK2 domain-containing protein, partial [Chloroflexota bacterium]
MKVGSFGESCARVGAIVSRCDGAALLRVIEAAAARLEREVAQVDALNVYPLPDGDTGRNMLQTMRAALARARDVDGSASAVSAALARGALMGARGNSGVILSQILAGLCDALTGKDDLGASELRDAIAGGRRKAYAAVDRPAEGTILSHCAALPAP